MNSELNEIIEDQVKSKVSELSTWKQVRWQGGRLYYETETIKREISDYDTDTKILYLECLLNKNYTIQDNWPSSAPDITCEFKNWIVKTISHLKIIELQQTKINSVKMSVSKKKTRLNVPNKTRSILQKQINSKCPFCTNEDVEHFQVHHIDENPNNNVLNNLLMVCPNCHSKITKQDISQEEVLEKKRISITIR